MGAEIEAIDRRRLRYLEGYLIGFWVFMVLWTTRFFFRASDLNSRPVGLVVLTGLIVAVAVQAIFMIRLAGLGRRIQRDPALRSALNNELVVLYEARSWKAAFLSAVASTVFFALVSLVYPITDLVFVALTAIIVGAGSYRLAFYLMYRSS
ncbi:MAG: hypothetical protein OEN01_03240 [Candidatus Krumholzibacteria bacterium]|nr:hypothetical protein [Candidatus Krumholzibacteria bacterium]